MKFLYALFLTLISLCCQATTRTTIDSVEYRFHFIAEISTTEEKKTKFPDEIIVDIGKKYVHCYGRYEEENTYLLDSILGHGGTASDYFALGNPVGMYHNHIFKQYPSKGTLTCTDKNDAGKYIYQEAIVSKKWKLEEGDTTILGYLCKKATCTFRQRSWTVWYTLDIPISEGPWKLDGLPGMILKAVDTQERFSFECISIKENVRKPMQMWNFRYQKITPIILERWEKLKRKDYHAYLKAIGKDKKIIWDYHPKPLTACLLEYYEPTKSNK